MEKVIETNVETTEEKVVKKTKQPKSIKVQKKRSVSDLSLNERVPVDNLCDWGISFISEENGKDIIIPASVRNYKKLTLAEIDAQVKIGNIVFCGTDEYGSHAAIRITDPVVREFVFGEDISPIQTTEENIKELLDTENRNEFNNLLSSLVVTRAEKRMIVRLCEKIGVENVASYKIAAIEKISGIKFD